jgi:hypothetical protein
MRCWVAAMTAVATALTWTASALAQQPTERVYGGEAGVVQQGVAGVGTGGGGTLPFTGLDLTLMLGAALLLVATGVAMRRLARSRN